MLVQILGCLLQVELDEERSPGARARCLGRERTADMTATNYWLISENLVPLVMLDFQNAFFRRSALEQLEDQAKQCLSRESSAQDSGLHGSRCYHSRLLAKGCKPQHVS